MEEHVFGFQINFRISSKQIVWGDVVLHCPENAKIYANRVVEDVLILSGSVECITMPALDFVGEVVSAQPVKPSAAPPCSPSAAPPPGDPAVKLSFALTGDGSVVEQMKIDPCCYSKKLN